MTTWSDKSGNGYSATGVNNPTYNSTSNGIAFAQASTQYMTLPDGCLPYGDSSYSYMLVLTPSTVGQTQIQVHFLSGGSNTTNQKFGWRSEPDWSVRTYWYGVDQQTSNQLTTNVRNFTASYYTSGGARSTWVNFVQGVSDTPAAHAQTSANNAIGTLLGGGADTMNGQFHELVVFNTSLPTTQRQQVEGYLAWKWGLTSNLPSTHPFKTFKP